MSKTTLYSLKNFVNYEIRSQQKQNIFVILRIKTI